MGKARLRIDNIFIQPEDYNVTIRDDDYKMLFCLGRYAFDNNLVNG